MSTGPLAGTRVVEMVGMGPAPFGAMMLADLGAEVVSVLRPGGALPEGGLGRDRPALVLDLKADGAAGTLLDLVEHADVLVDAFRPGVMERLGAGPDECQRRNPRLVYARMTGWGQSGPLAFRAGHDITYIAITGALHSAARRGERPVPPANLLGDFGGGGMYLVASVLAALLERSRTGVGTVLDVAIVDGTTYLMSMLYGLRAEGGWGDVAGTNLLDTGAPYYDVYTCADSRYVAIGALEPQFFVELLDLLGLDPQLVLTRTDPASWPELRRLIGAAVATRTRDEWATLAASTDACLAPVLDLAEAPTFEHMAARALFPEGDTERASTRTAMPRLPGTDHPVDARPHLGRPAPYVGSQR